MPEVYAFILHIAKQGRIVGLNFHPDAGEFGGYALTVGDRTLYGDTPEEAAARFPEFVTFQFGVSNG